MPFPSGLTPTTGADGDLTVSGTQRIVGDKNYRTLTVPPGAVAQFDSDAVIAADTLVVPGGGLIEFVPVAGTTGTQGGNGGAPANKNGGGGGGGGGYGTGGSAGGNGSGGTGGGGGGVRADLTALALNDHPGPPQRGASGGTGGAGKDNTLDYGDGSPRGARQRGRSPRRRDLQLHHPRHPRGAHPERGQPHLAARPGLHRHPGGRRPGGGREPARRAVAGRGRGAPRSPAPAGVVVRAGTGRTAQPGGPPRRRPVGPGASPSTTSPGGRRTRSAPVRAGPPGARAGTARRRASTGATAPTVPGWPGRATTTTTAPGSTPPWSSTPGPSSEARPTSTCRATAPSPETSSAPVTATAGARARRPTASATCVVHPARAAPRVKAGPATTKSNGAGSGGGGGGHGGAAWGRGLGRGAGLRHGRAGHRG